MEFGEAFGHNLRKPFEGRASRSEYWWFFLWNIIIFVAIFAVLGVAIGGLALSENAGDNLGAGALASVGVIGFLLIFPLYALLGWMALAGFCTAGRRLHDRNMSAWWLLLWIIPYIGWLALVIIFCLRGTQGPNRFGPDPLNPDNATIFE